MWRALQPPLLRYLQVRDRDTAEDIAAETWLQVVRDLHRFHGGPADFRAWLFTVARHRAIDAGRARAARPSVPTGEVLDIGVAPSAESLAIEQISTDEAISLVAQLPAAQAEMVMLRVVAGLPVTEVAAIVGKKPGTVAVAVHRALKRLGSMITDPPAEPSTEHATENSADQNPMSPSSPRTTPRGGEHHAARRTG